MLRPVKSLSCQPPCTMRFGSTIKILAKRVLKHHRILLCPGELHGCTTGCSTGQGFVRAAAWPALAVLNASMHRSSAVCSTPDACSPVYYHSDKPESSWFTRIASSSQKVSSATCASVPMSWLQGPIEISRSHTGKIRSITQTRFGVAHGHLGHPCRRSCLTASAHAPSC